MNDKTKDYLLKTILWQAIICTAVSLSLFAASSADSEFRNKLRDELIPIICSTITKNEALQAFRSVSNIINTDSKSEDTNPVFSSTDETTPDVTSSPESEITVTIPSEGGVDLTCDYLNELSDKVNLAVYSVSGNTFYPLKGEITSVFGERIHPIYNTVGFHTGIDIAADSGTEIRSYSSGTVSEVSYSYGNGNYVVINHGSGVFTKYCHCSKITVNNGDSVEAGEVVATVGSTGLSTGPHLHFEFRIHNIAHNPQYALNCADED